MTYDKNGNGIIDDGSEMFGETNAANGFEALKKFDDNKDGKIDENDDYRLTRSLGQAYGSLDCPAQE